MSPRLTTVLVAMSFVVAVGCSASNAQPAKHSAATFTVRVEPDDGDDRWITVRVESSDPAVWSRFAAVDLARAVRLNVAGTETKSDSAGVLGSVEVDGSELRFHPRYALLPGTTYIATFSPAVVRASGSPIISRYEVALRPAEPPRVVALYPTTDKLPANHLKFYLHFSEPMERGDIWDYFRVVDKTTGDDVPSPFRHTELWSEDGLRLTLWFHPGRQKTGVNLNVEIGPILEEGRRYTLVVSKAWRSQAGQPFAEDIRKSIFAVAPDHTQPDIESWTLTTPPAGSREPLVVDFPEPLDWALLQSQLRVEDMNGRQVHGVIVTANEERSWQFIPGVPWSAGGHRLAIGTVLEDLTGNNLQRPFEVDLTTKRPVDLPPVVYRVFEVIERQPQQRGRRRKENPVITKNTPAAASSRGVGFRFDRFRSG
ncbi:MAG: hypothetical protein HZA46_14170 [Planctomycetales bacterium]|nr:hypothetical protein [Planctomycetales bacterium]